MSTMKMGPHRDCGGNPAISSIKIVFSVSILSIKAMMCPWLSVCVCLKLCEKTLVLVSSDTGLYSSSVLVSYTGKLSMRHCDPGEKLGGMGVELTPFTYCLGGLDLSCGKWLLSSTFICSFKPVVWTSTIFHCCYIVFTLFPSRFTSMGNWKGKWGCGRMWHI